MPEYRELSSNEVEPVGLLQGYRPSDFRPHRLLQTKETDDFARGAIYQYVKGNPDADNLLVLCTGRKGTDWKDRYLLYGPATERMEREHEDLMIILNILAAGVTYEENDPEPDMERLETIVRANSVALAQIVDRDVRAFGQAREGRQWKAAGIGVSASAAGLLFGMMQANEVIPGGGSAAVIAPSRLVGGSSPIREVAEYSAFTKLHRFIGVLARNDELFNFHQSMEQMRWLGGIAGETVVFVDSRLPKERMPAHNGTVVGAIAQHTQLLQELGVS